MRLWLPVILQFIQTFVPLAVFINSTPCCKVYMTPFLKTLEECDTLSALLLLSIFTIGEQPPIEEVHLHLTTPRANLRLWGIRTASLRKVSFSSKIVLSGILPISWRVPPFLLLKVTSKCTNAFPELPISS